VATVDPDRSPRISRRGLLTGLGVAAVVAGGVGIGLSLGGSPTEPAESPPAGPRWTYPVRGARALTPGAGVLYVTGDSAEVHAVDVATGQPRWTFTTREGSRRPATITEGIVVAGGGATYGLAAGDGRRLWQADDVGYRTAGSGIVIGQTRDTTAGTDGLVGLDAATGARRWTYPLGDAPPTDLPVIVGPTGAHLALGDVVVALDPNSGAARWRYTATTPISHLDHLDDTVICVPALGGADEVVALDAATGTPRWTHTLEFGTQSIAVHDGNLYVHGISDVESWDASGDQRWSTRAPLGGTPWPTFEPSTIAAAEHGCYLAGFHGIYDDSGRSQPIRDASSFGGSDAQFALFAFSASSGRLRWRLPIEASTELLAPAPPLAAVPGTVLVRTPEAVLAIPET
jgi:outer membrane protein assembly factor BamB